MAKNAIAIIPARGGSKRIPKKNIKDFFGKPLIAYSIEVALASNLFEKVIVTTDDENIAKIAIEYGAEVPFLRPKELSDDFTGTVDVVNHAIAYLENQGENYKYICTIYATAPLLQKEYLIEAYKKLQNSDAINAFSATSMSFPIQRTFKLDNNGRCEMFTPEHYMSRSQDLEEAYQDAGQFYWTKRDEKSKEIMFGKDSIPIILPRHLVQDIDTIEDWKRAEYMYEVICINIANEENILNKGYEMTTPKQLKELYSNGENISKFLRDELDLENNTKEIIEISYDLQAGSYISGMENKETRQHKDNYSKEIASIILALCEPNSILEAGVGEATTLSGVLKNLGNNVDSYGFDISWSRIAYAKDWLRKNGLTDTVLCTGDLFQIPFLDNSIDVVYTSHSIEPNGGHEKAILKELFRITRKYLVLLEPGYEFANDESKQRMDYHGYCKNLKKISESLGYKVIEHKLFPLSANPLNPTAITIISKNANTKLLSNVLACPKFKTPLEKIEDTMFSAEALAVYPIIGGIPCLRIENSIFMSKYKEFMQ